MTTHSLMAHRVHVIPRPELHAAAWICLGALVLLGLGAFAGGFALAAQPDGGVMGFSVALLAGSPFTDFFVPGLILGGLFGLGSFVVVALGLLRSRFAPFLAFAIGVGQMIWIVVELAIIREVSFLHPVCFGIGLVIATSAVRWGWPTFEGWRTR
jgi:hypothetical protein